MAEQLGKIGKPDAEHFTSKRNPSLKSLPPLLLKGRGIKGVRFINGLLSLRFGLAVAIVLV